MNDQRVTLGRIAGLFGIKGWVKVFSYTQPRDNIAAYPCWHLESEEGQHALQVEACQSQGKTVVAKLVGIDDRDAASALVGANISVAREQLPPPAPGSYYWTDLENLAVHTVDGVVLGCIDHLIETGANDVLVVHGERERLIPFIWGQTVREINLDQGVLVVDWDPDF